MFENELLKIYNKSLLIVTERNSSEIVIASPHHAPLGRSSLPCKEHSIADEGVGFLSDYIAKELGYHSIVASNYFVDANKDENYDYFRKIKEWNPKLLIEIHGHGSKSAHFPIEISAGSKNDNLFSIQFAELLTKNLSCEFNQKFMICGDFTKIYFTAHYSATIITNQWKSLHIELPFPIRSHEALAEEFCDAMILSIKEIYPSL